jgi:hypothetical protein
MSPKPKAPKRAPKAAKPAPKKIKPTLEQLELRLEELSARVDFVRDVQHACLSKMEECVVAHNAIAPRVEKLEAKVFPPDPTPEDWKAVAEAAKLAYEQRREKWKTSFRSWVSEVLATGAKIPASIPREYFEMAFGMDWGSSGTTTFDPISEAKKRIQEDRAAAQQAAPVGGGFKGSARDYFGYKVQPPVWDCPPCAFHEKDCSPRGTLKRKVFCYSQKTNRTPSEVWHKLYDTLMPILGYDPRTETTLTERALHVLERMGHLPQAMSVLDAWLDRLAQAA